MAPFLQINFPSRYIAVSENSVDRKCMTASWPTEFSWFRFPLSFSFYSELK